MLLHFTLGVFWLCDGLVDVVGGRVGLGGRVALAVLDLDNDDKAEVLRPMRSHFPGLEVLHLVPSKQPGVQKKLGLNSCSGKRSLQVPSLQAVIPERQHVCLPLGDCKQTNP